MAEWPDFDMKKMISLPLEPKLRVEGTISTWEELRDLVERRMSWRPDTRLELWIDGEGDFLRDPYAIALLVQMKVPDTYDPAHRVTLVTHRRPLFIHLPAPEEGVIRQIRHELHAVDMHESDEWIKVDGAMLFDPHAGRA